jgi:uncharacterized integral membrane protein (TIGR00698 family)
MLAASPVLRTAANMFSWLLRMPDINVRAGQIFPGLLFCGALGAIATAMAAWGGSGVVWALLLGIAIASIRAPAARWIGGIDFASRHVLRLGVALLGLQISAAAFHVLSLTSVAVLAINVAAVLLAGFLLGPIIGIDRRLSLVLAAAVAICGASAAAAFALVLLPDEAGRRDIGLTIGTVSLLSMSAMLLYAPIAQLMQLDPGGAGFLLGGSIHEVAHDEVAHAVAAGYSIDQATGDIATMTKLLRVALLAPALLLTAWTQNVAEESNSVPRPPWFLVCFALFAVANIAGLVPRVVSDMAAPSSRFCLVMAMAAIGLMLPWRSLTAYGWRPLAMLLALTGLLFALAAAYVRISGL